MTKKDTRGKILDAADRILAQNGLAGTTLEAVAVEADVSKGGLLHHFKSKDELLLAGLRRFEKRFSNRREEIYQSLPATPCRRAKATFMAMLDMRRQEGGSAHYRVDILEDMGFRSRIGVMKKNICDDLLAGARHPEKVALTLYVLDGLWMESFFEPSHIPAQPLQKVRQWLIGYIESLYAEYD